LGHFYHHQCLCASGETGGDHRAARDAVSETKLKTETKPGKGRAVLVVDDEEYVREFMQDSLERAGYRVVTAEGGEQALRVLRSNPEIRLILLDLIMPVRSGDAILGDIARERPDVAVLVTSGYGEEEARRLIATYPRRAFIRKPYTAEELARKVSAVLDGGISSSGQQ
jgi:CheY-like chemotaxis protein